MKKKRIIKFIDMAIEIWTKIYLYIVHLFFTSLFIYIYLNGYEATININKFGEAKIELFILLFMSIVSTYYAYKWLRE